MKQNVKMAKVITMKTLLNEEGYTILVVTTVDPSVTPEMAKFMYGIPGPIISSEETKSMPLTFALDYARRQREKFGIKNYVSYINNQAA